MLRHFWSTC